MSRDICFAVSHAPCDYLFHLLRKLVTYLAGADVNVTLICQGNYLCFSSTCRGRWQPVQASLLFVERVLRLAERGQLFSTSAEVCP